ncbi:MAG: cadmium-translocating P-type ATPase [Methanocorpusculum sp.]|nr:cadmium-translocating P-type ATPase [Methanocorpusculum sp.]
MKFIFSEKQKHTIRRIIIAAVLTVLCWISPLEGLARLCVFLIPYLIIGWDVLWNVVKNIPRGKIFDEHFLMGIATIGALVLGEYPEAVAVMLFFRVGELFEECAVENSRRSVTALVQAVPKTTVVLRNGREEIVHPETVSPGEIILIKPGERISLDGVIVGGSSAVDTSALTGESIPRPVALRDGVLSGSINLSGVLTVRVVKRFEDSTASRILELVEDAAAKKAKPEKFISVFARYYTPVVCALAVLTALIPPLLFGGIWSDWISRALIFLVVSCPCALVISIPMSFFGGIGAASRHGILIKGGNYLEMLSRANTFAFDKTGTLTTGKFTVVSADEKALRLGAYAGCKSTHPLSVSLREAWGKEIPADAVMDICESRGRGISAVVEGERVFIGSERYLKEQGISLPPLKFAGTAVHTACEGIYTGSICFSDVPKPDAVELISQLKKSGIKRTVLLTGDKKDAADAVSRVTGVDEIHAELLPEEKLSVLEDLFPSSSGVVYVGDGINDAPALARADVGITLGTFGSDAAVEASDIVIMDDSLSKIYDARRISRKTMRIAAQNIIFSLGVKAAVLLLAGFGYANMWMAVFADVGVAVLVILNAMRLLRG